MNSLFILLITTATQRIWLPTLATLNLNTTGPYPPLPNPEYVNYTTSASTITITYTFDPQVEWYPPYTTLNVHLMPGNPFDSHDYNKTINITEPPLATKPLVFTFSSLSPYRPYAVFLTLTNEAGSSVPVRHQPDVCTNAVAPPVLKLDTSRLRYWVSTTSAEFEILLSTSDCTGPNTTLAGLLYSAGKGNSIQGKNWFKGWKSCAHKETLARFSFIDLEPLTTYDATFWIENALGCSTFQNDSVVISTKPSGPVISSNASKADEEQTSPISRVCVYDLSNRVWFNFHQDWFIAEGGLKIEAYEVVLVETDILKKLDYGALFNQSVTWLQQVNKPAPFRVTADGWNPFRSHNDHPDCCYLENGPNGTILNGTTCGCERLGSKCRETNDMSNKNTVTVIIGGAVNNCSGQPNSSLCVGFLRAETNYSIYIRAWSTESEKYNLTPSLPVNLTFVVSGPSDSKGGIIAGTIIGVVAAAAVLFLAIYVIRTDYQNRHSAGKTLSRDRATSKVSPEASSPSKGELGWRASRPTLLPMPLPASQTPERRNELPRPVKVKDLMRKVIEMSADGEFLFQEEHEIIEENSPPLPYEQEPLTARHDCNRCKNRFTNILPFDSNRVKLMSKPVSEDYINASFITGQNRSREYIAAQGPIGDKEVSNSTFSGRVKVNTVNDFWLMIWEQKVEVVVMLTRVVERARVKCAQYWPLEVNGSETHGSITVTLLSEYHGNAYIISILDVTLDNESRRVRHYNFLNWADFDAPTDPSEVLEFVEEIRGSIPSTSSAPVLVHCSAGVGRSGTYIAIDSLLPLLRDNDSVDIFSFVMQLRKQRVQMVQSQKQYALIYRALALAESRQLEELRERQEDGLRTPDTFRTTVFIHNEDCHHQTAMGPRQSCAADIRIVTAL